MFRKIIASEVTPVLTVFMLIIGLICWPRDIKTIGINKQIAGGKHELYHVTNLDQKINIHLRSNNSELFVVTSIYNLRKENYVSNNKGDLECRIWFVGNTIINIQVSHPTQIYGTIVIHSKTLSCLIYLIVCFSIVVLWFMLNLAQSLVSQNCSPEMC